MNYKYQLEYEDLGVDYLDEGLWRSYEADGRGHTEEEFLEDLTIAEVDQDGGEITCYGYGDAPNDVQIIIDNFIKNIKEGK